MDRPPRPLIVAHGDTGQRWRARHSCCECASRRRAKPGAKGKTRGHPGFSCSDASGIRGIRDKESGTCRIVEESGTFKESGCKESGKESGKPGHAELLAAVVAAAVSCAASADAPLRQHLSDCRPGFLHARESRDARLLSAIVDGSRLA
jgi:hypothetical protein